MTLTILNKLKKFLKNLIPYNIKIIYITVLMLISITLLPSSLVATNEDVDAGEGDTPSILKIPTPVDPYKHLPKYNIPLSLEFRNFVWEQANKAHFSYELILAIMYVESRFDKNAKSNYGDLGICQVNIDTWHWIKGELGLNNPFDPRQNVRAAIYYLSYLRDKILHRYPGIPQEELFSIIVSCYNTGETIFFEQGYVNKDYVNAVLDYKMKLERGEKL